MNSVIKFCIFLFIISVYSCSEEERSNKLNAVISSKNYSITSFNTVFYLTEEGCPQCNRVFAELMESHLNNDSILIITSAKGVTVDISEIFNFKNIIRERNQEKLKSIGFTDKSSCIFLTKEGRIDTLIEIGAKNLESTLGYIEKRLTSPVTKQYEVGAPQSSFVISENYVL